MNKETKNQTLQILRALAIIFVLIRHSISQVSSNTILKYAENIIICFHMPTFFIISGYLFQKNIDKYKKQRFFMFIKSKIIHLIIPYIFWTVVLWAGIQIISSVGIGVQSRLAEIGFQPMGVGKLIYGILTYEVYYTEHLWFLYVLFVLFLINYLLQNIQNKKIMIVILAFIGIINSYLSFPYIVGKILHWALFFIIGSYIASNEKIELRLQMLTKPKNVIAILMCFIILCTIRIFDISQYTPYFIKNGIFTTIEYTVGLIGVLILYIIATTINLRRNKKENIFNKYLVKIGNYSYSIYLIHNPYIVALTSIVLSKILGINVFVTIAISVILGIIIPIKIDKIISYSKILSRLMFGK